MHRLRKGDQSDLSFHKEHDSKVAVLSCLPDEPVCADDKGSNDELFCFIYTTVFKKVKDSIRRPRSPDNMGKLDRDLCLFWKSVAAANIIFPTASIIPYEFFETQLEIHIG